MPGTESLHAGAEALLATVLDGKYQIDRIVGTGGMSTVYGATRLQIGDQVAIKVLSFEAMRQPLAVKRFQREARAVARIKHPNVISVHDFGALPDERAYLVMEYIQGGSLRDELKSKVYLSPERVLTIMQAVCAAVHAAHEEGVIHRDLKPENVMLSMSRNGTELIKVVDFGVAELRESTTNSALTKLTEIGLVVGTPHYMSPEQCRSEPLDARSDVYSLGVILYELLTGTVPFNARTVSAVIIQQATEQPRRLRDLRPEIDPTLEIVVLRALEKDPALRPQTASELAHNLHLAVTSTKKIYEESTLITEPKTLSFAPKPEANESNPDNITRQITKSEKNSGSLSPSDSGRRFVSLRRTSSLQFDSLTGIYNNFFISQKIDELLTQSQHLSLLTLGIDKLTTINNQYGYPIGDNLLKELANWLREQVGDQGIVSRLISDEFAILMSDSYIEETISFADALRQELLSHFFLKNEIPGGLNISLTISVVFTPDDGNTAQDLLEAGAHALKQAKQTHYGNIYRLGQDINEQTTGRLNFNTFIGRSNELKVLSQILEKVLRGRGKPTFIIGDTGLGKTRLVKEFRRQTTRQNISFLTGHFYQSGKALPYKAFYESLHTAVRLLLETNRDNPEYIFGSLTNRVLQNFSTDQGFSNFSETVQNISSVEKYLIFEYLTDLYLILAQQKPVILFLDNIHLADELSLEFLGYLARASTGQRLMILSATRSDIIVDRHPVRNLMRTLNQLMGYETITLEPLSIEDTHHLLEAIFSQPHIDPAIAIHLYTETSGNPYFLRETIRYLIKQGQFVYKNNIWECNTPEDIPLPQSVIDLVEASINKATADTLDILTQAAVIGHEFTFDILQDITERSEQEILAAIENGLEYGLIDEIEDKEDDSYKFHHRTIQKILYSRLNRRRRRTMHAQIGRALEQQYSTPSRFTKAITQLAYHYYQAGEHQQTLKYATTAGKQAWQKGAIKEAKNFYTWAEEAEQRLNLVPEMINEEEISFEKISTDQLNILVDLNLYYGQLLIGLGKTDEAEKKLQIALALSKHLNNELLRGYTLAALGEMCEAKSEYTLALLYCRQALEILRRLGDIKMEVRTLCTTGMVYDRLGQLTRALDSHEKALVMAYASKDKLYESIALRELAYSLTKQGLFRRAIESAKAAYEIATQLNDLLGKSITTSILGLAYFAQGNVEHAINLFQESLKTSIYLNRPRGKAIELINLGECYRLKNELAKAFEINQQVLTVSHQINDRQLEAAALLHIGRIYQNRQEYSQAIEYCNQSLAIITTINDKLLECDALITVSEIYLVQNLPSEALETLQTVITTTENIKALPSRWRALFIKGQCHQLLEDIPSAKDSFSEAVEVVNQMLAQLSTDTTVTIFLEDKKALFTALNNISLS